MSRILILNGRYIPGYKDGGPVRTLVNLVSIFGREVEINILCLDRDYDDVNPYPGIKVNEFNRVGNANVYYASEDNYNVKLIEKLAVGMDLVYCCGPYGFFTRDAVRLNKMGKLDCPLMIASMGSFSPKAIAIKGLKKRAFFIFMKLLKMYKDVTWSVTSEREDSELRVVLGNKVVTYIAEDLPRTTILPHTKIKKKGHLDIIFLSRIAVKKNLITAAYILKLLPEGLSFNFDIYGIMEDEEYFKECEKVLKTLPKNVKYEYKGEAAPETVMETLSEYDVFLFPTLGENYGHVIAEAMAAGTIPLISDETPWLDMEKYDAGYALSLENTAAFAEVLMNLAREDEDAFRIRVNNTKKYIEEHNRESIENSGYREIFKINGNLND